MKKVAYIIEMPQKTFKGFISLLIPDGDDSALFVIHSTKRFQAVEEVQEELKKLPSEIKTFMKPITSSSGGLSWLSELEKA